jgi:hypothetical protein
MPSIILTVLATPQVKTYAHERIESQSRRTVYRRKEHFSDSDGCHAIRLTHCGHIVGHECFEEWIQQYPETCIYWNHELPLVINVPKPTSGVMKLFDWWLKILEKLLMNLPYCNLAERLYIKFLIHAFLVEHDGDVYRDVLLAFWMNVAFMIGALGIFKRLICCTLLFIKQKTAED